MKKLLITAALATLAVGCSDANVASSNLSKAADQFEINRRVVFYNGITGEYMLTIEGMCSLGNYDKAKQLSVTCKTGPGEYKKHFLGLSDNVTYVVEQVEPFAANPYRYRVVFKPAALVPDIAVSYTHLRAHETGRNLVCRLLLEKKKNNE